MGADIKKLKTRIKSVDSTLHLTKAMGLVASSKIKRATDAMHKSREYAENIENAISMMTACRECMKSPFMQKRNSEKTALIIIAGDRGLAGGYNANIFRLAKEYKVDEVFAIGKRACDRFGGDLKLAETFTYRDAMALSKELCVRFREGEFDRVGIISTKYVSMMSQEAQLRWVLPLEKNNNVITQSIVFEPDEITILDTAIFEYMTAMIIAAVRESFASEVAARRFAMDSAGKNAGQMLDDLQLRYNRARQGAITQEITEIVAGSDA